MGNQTKVYESGLDSSQTRILTFTYPNCRCDVYCPGPTLSDCKGICRGGELSYNPVPALCGFKCTHQLSKIRRERGLGGTIRILEIRGLFWTEKSRKSEKGGLIHPTLISYLVCREKII